MYVKSIRTSAKREVQKERSAKRDVQKFRSAERDDRALWSAKRDDQIARPRRAQTCARGAQWECARQVGRFFIVFLLKIVIFLAEYFIYWVSATYAKLKGMWCLENKPILLILGFYMFVFKVHKILFSNFGNF